MVIRRHSFLVFGGLSLSLPPKRRDDVWLDPPNNCNVAVSLDDCLLPIATERRIPEPVRANWNREMIGQKVQATNPISQSVKASHSLTPDPERTPESNVCSRGTNTTTTTDGREWISLSDRKATRKTAQKSIKIIFNYGPIKWKRLSTFILIHFLLSLSLGCVCCVWILFLTSCEILWLDSEVHSQKHFLVSSTIVPSSSVGWCDDDRSDADGWIAARLTQFFCLVFIK